MNEQVGEHNRPLNLVGDIERSVFLAHTKKQMWQKCNNSSNYVDFHEVNNNLSMQSEFDEENMEMDGSTKTTTTKKYKNDYITK